MMVPAITQHVSEVHLSVNLYFVNFVFATIRPFPSANNSNPLSQRVHLGPNVDGSSNGSNFGTLLCPSISAKVSDCVPALTKCLIVYPRRHCRMARYYELNTPIELGNSLYFTCHI